MIYLTDEDKEKLQSNGFESIKKVNLSSGSYYIKYCGDTASFRELFGKKIFDMIGIRCPNYYYVKDKHSVLSEDIFKKNPNFKFAFELGEIISINDLYVILKQFKNYDELVLQMNIVHFMDTLFCNVDRNSSNYGFSINEDGTAKLIVFDNGLMLEDFYHATRPVSFPSKNVVDYVLYSKECEYEYFFNNIASSEFKELISYYLRKFNIKTVYSIMNNVKRENGIKINNKNFNKLFFKFIKNYIMIYKITLSENKKLKVK